MSISARRAMRASIQKSIPAWRKPVIGITGGSESAFNEINAQVGNVRTRRTYNGSLPASWANSNAASDVAAGRMSYWSWKPDVKTFPTDTAAQAAFSSFLDTIPAGHETVIVAWHEPEDNIDRGDWTLLEWGALQDAMTSIVKSKNRPELRTGMCFMGPWTFDTRSGRTGWDWEGCMDWSQLDVVGIDPYRTTAGSSMSLETMLTVPNSGSGGGQPSMMAKLASWGKPISLMEWGVYNSTEASSATFITEAYDWMKRWNQANLAVPIESAIYFNYTLIGSDNMLTGVEVDAYAAIVTDSKGETPPPPPPPVQWIKPVIGVADANEERFNVINEKIGYVNCRRTYNVGLPSSWANSTAFSDVTAGRMSYWSWKPDVKTFPTDNAAKTAFSNFLDTIPAGHPTVIMAWHEPEDNIDNGDWTLLEWGALQDAVTTIVKSKNRPEMRTGMCFMGPWTFDTRSGRTNWNWEGCMEWSRLDVVGIDPYRMTEGSTTSLETMLTINNSGSGNGGSTPSMMAKLASWGKPISIMEWGVLGSTEESKVTFLTEAYDWMKRWNQANVVTPIESAIYFNVWRPGQPHDLELKGIEVDAYAGMVADSKIPPA